MQAPGAAQRWAGPLPDERKPRIDPAVVFGEVPVPDLGTILVASHLVLLASVVRGFSGFGFAIAAVPLLTFVLAPAKVVPVVMLLQTLAGVGTAARAWRSIDWSIMRWLWAGSLLGLGPGLALLGVLPPDTMRLAIAAIVTLAVLSLALGLRLRVIPGRAAIIGIGALAGLLNGAAAMPGPPVIALYLAVPQSIEACRASLTTFFLATAVMGTTLAFATGLIDVGSLALAATLVPPLVLGSWLGERLFRLGGARFYRPAALILLAVVALVSLLRTLHGS